MSRVYNSTFDEQSGKHLQGEPMCPECDGRIRAASGERTCEQCGLVVEERRIDHGPEWRTFEDDAEPSSRVGAPRTPTRHDRGLSTTIGFGGTDADSQLAAGKRRRLMRQRRWHKRAKATTKRERNEIYGYTEIRRLYCALDLPRWAWERACDLFRRAQEASLFQGRTLDAFTAGALYAACRCRGLPRQIEAFEEHAREPLQKIRNAYRVLNVELELETEFRTPSDFVPKYASAVALSPQARRLARALVEEVEREGSATSGGRTSGVAAACVYIASQEVEPEPTTQHAVAEAAHVSKNTVRSRRDEIRDAVAIEGVGR